MKFREPIYCTGNCIQLHIRRSVLFLENFKFDLTQTSSVTYSSRQYAIRTLVDEATKEHDL